MLQFHDLDASDLLRDEPVVPAPCVELGPPPEEDAPPQPVLVRFELGSELGVLRRCDVLGLWVVEGSVEKQVGVRTRPLTAALLPGDRVVAHEPHPRAAGGELVGADDTVVDDDSRDDQMQPCMSRAHPFWSGSAGDRRMCPRAHRRSCVELRENRLASPPFETTAHATRMGRFLP